MLVRLLYASRATAAMDPEALHALMRHCKAENPKHGITGVLCLSSGVFMQVLEGGRMAVNRLYNRIAADPRHAEVVLLDYREITERRFAGWAMGQVQVSRINPAMLLKYSETATLDPYAVSGEASVALFDELVATASIMAERGG